MTLLSANDLSVEVSERLLCQELFIEIKPGECWGILGPNGSGKTTLLHTLAGLLSPQQGEITLQHAPLQSLTRRQIAQCIGLLLQDSHDPFPASVWETVLSGRHPHLSRWQQEGEQDRQLALQALQTMQLDGMQQRQIQTLSGGERRRLAFATLLTQAPPLMLLDEPLNHLDLRHQQLLLHTVTTLCEKGHAVMMVLHDPNHAMHYCDRVLMLEGDSGWQQGRVEEVMSAERLGQLYECEIESTEAGGRRWFHYL